MSLLTGVYPATKKNGQTYFRSSITYKNKHISLGSFETEEEAHYAYLEGETLIRSSSLYLEDYRERKHHLPFSKWVILINFRDNNLYCKTPIYIKSNYFVYYLSKDCALKFDVDDLFYYAKHQICKRGGYLFVSEYGMQVNILSRYGIKSFAVAGKDYIFSNGDTSDYRYANIKVINRYHGVTKEIKSGLPIYVVKIHIRGDYIVGRYKTEIEAAIAYNKAAKLLKEKNVKKEFLLNYIEELNAIEYASLYNKIRLSKRIRNYEMN